MTELLKAIVGLMLATLILVLACLVGPIASYLLAYVVQAVFPTAVGGFMSFIGATITFPQLAAVLSFLGAVTFPKLINTKESK